MNTYIGVKIIEAKSLNRGDYNKYRGWQIPVGENPADEGYLVKYEDNYESWSPKEVFDRAYRLMNGKNNTITQQDVDDFIIKVESVQFGEKTTLVKAELANGFIIVESSSCVNANNFDMEYGTEICVEKIKDKVWFLLGFLLQCGTGLNNK